MIQEVKLSTTAGIIRSLVYTPDNMVAIAKYPCLIVFNGMDENANDGDITLVYKHGPMYHLKDGVFRPSDLVVIDIFPPMDFPKPEFVNAVLDVIVRLPYVNATSLHALGISAGAETWMMYFLKSQANVNRIASAIILSCTNKPVDTYFANPSIQSFLWKLPFLFFHGTLDINPHAYAVLQRLYKDIVSKGNTKAIWVPMEKTGHSGWETVLNPKYLLPNTQISAYNWFMNYAIAPPVAPVVPKLVNTITVQIFDNGSTVIKEVKPTAAPRLQTNQEISDVEAVMINGGLFEPQPHDVVGDPIHRGLGVEMKNWIYCEDVVASTNEPKSY